MNLLGKIKSFNVVKRELVFQLSFLDEKVIQDIEDAIHSNRYTRIEIKKGRVSRNDTGQKARNRWYGVISCILKWQGIEVTSETLTAFHREMKMSMFEVDRFVVDGRTVPIIPSINKVGDEAIHEACNELEASYGALGCVFNYGELI